MTIKLNLLALLVGVVGGLGSWAFRRLIEGFFFLFVDIPRASLPAQASWLPFLLAPAAGGLLVGVLTSKVSAETRGHGVPEVLEAVALRSGRMNARVPFVKIVASAATIGSGGSAGREGPIAQIGAGFASVLGQRLRLRDQELRTLVVAGVCGGISATFNAPIGGFLFAVEVFFRQTTVSFFIPLMVSSVAGAVTGQLVLGTSLAFNGFPAVPFVDDYGTLPALALLGLATGVASAGFIKFFYATEDSLQRLAKRFNVPPVAFSVLGGSLVGLILLATYLVAGEDWRSFTTAGMTYEPIEKIFSGKLLEGPVGAVAGVLLLMFALKVLATSLTLGSGGSGGVFAPSLFLGATLGGIFGAAFSAVGLVEASHVPVFALAGMAGFFVGVGRAPATAIVIVAEMTGDYLLTVPLMVVVAVSFVVSRVLERQDIYVAKLARRGVFARGFFVPLLASVRVRKVMTTVDRLVALDANDTVGKALELIEQSNHEGFPVLSDGRVVGVLEVAKAFPQLLEVPKESRLGDHLPSGNHVVHVSPDDDLERVVDLMEAEGASKLPVVAQGKLVGWLTHSDVVRGYKRAAAAN